MNKMTCGIYKIQNIINGKISIGSSKNIEKRLKEHKGQLINGCHPNTKFQADFDTYGLDAFSFEIVESLPLDIDEQQLFDREKFWTEEAHKKTGCYNPLHPRPRHGIGKKPNCIICDAPHYAKGYCNRHWIAYKKGKEFRP